MAKRRAFGVLNVGNGARVEVKNKHISRALEDNQHTIRQLVEQNNRTAGERRDALERLARLQNHWLVRFGEALRLIRP